MSNPMSSYTKDAQDFYNEYSKKNFKDLKQQDKSNIVQEFGERYERSYQMLNTYYAEAYKDLSYYLGNQWSLEELSYLNNQRRSSFTYNKIRRIINLVQGYQRKNRLATIVTPVEDSSRDTADLFTDVIQHVMNRGSGYQVISDAFKGALTTGMAFVSPYMDYREDPVNGDIGFHLTDWNAAIWDPFFTKKDMSDCSFFARRKYLTKSDIQSLLPEQYDKIEALPWGTRDDKFTYMPYARQWGMQKLLNYTEYWSTKWVTKNVLVDMNTGETHEWKGNKERLEFYKRMFPQIEVIKKPVRTVELGIIVEGELLYHETDPWGLDDYPFVPFFCVFEPSYDLYTWKIQSLVRICRDPQTELNKRRSKMVDIIDSQLNSGWIAKNNAVTNNSSLFKTGNGQVIFLKPEAQMSDIQRINAPDIPPGMFQLEQQFNQDIMELAGVNSELFGMAENDKVETAGILAKMRQAAGLVNLQDIFDNLRDSQKLLGDKTLKLIQKNFTPEKIKAITKKEVTPEFYSKQFAKYDIVVEEGILTDTQRQSQFVQLMALKQSGVAVPDTLIIKNSNLHNKKDLEDSIQQQAEQQQQMAALQLEQQKLQNESITNSMNAKAQSDQALAAERLNKIGLDQAINAERLSRAEEERTAGVLNILKAVKELESIDLATLQKKLELLKQLENTQEEKEKSNAQPSIPESEVAAASILE